MASFCAFSADGIVLQFCITVFKTGLSNYNNTVMLSLGESARAQPTGPYTSNAEWLYSRLCVNDKPSLPPGKTQEKLLGHNLLSQPILPFG
jgi:hypothetical protein